jgi:tRNA (guanine26-N2/guanine27-N2)-dimethyltransferase
VFECDDCQNNYVTVFGHTQIATPSVCEICNGKLSIFGPIWNDILHNVEFVKALLVSVEKSDLKTKKRIFGYLTGIIQEYNVMGNAITGFEISMLGKEVKCDLIPKEKLFGLINGLGYKVVQSFDKANIIKTTAPRNVLYDIYKLFVYTYRRSLKQIRMAI